MFDGKHIAGYRTTATDPWGGTYIAIWRNEDLVVTSPGPDRISDTADDILVDQHTLDRLVPRPVLDDMWHPKRLPRLNEK